MQLIKRNSHNNGTEVWDYDEQFHKVALNKRGNETLKKEKEGYDWFGIETTLEKDRLIVPAFKGYYFPFYNGITSKEEWIEKLIEFYNIRWEKGKYAVHGDLVLGNVIFGKQTYIVDWEHFHYADRRFVGFDLINMLFIHLQYEYRWFSYWGVNWVAFVSQKHKDFIRKCIKVSLLSKTMRAFPFSCASKYIQDYMDKDKFILGKQKAHLLESLDLICQ